MPRISLTPPPPSGARRPPPRHPRRKERRTPAPWIILGIVVAVIGGATFAVLDAFSRRVPELAPRHRPEALCFLLAEPPAFDPPMPVQPSTALVRGRFNAGTPASYALEQMMGFGPEHVLKQWVEHVGDFDVAAFWLHLPGGENDHWLVFAWMEGSDLGVCNFRFSGSSRELSAVERVWGERIIRRVLVPENFQRGVMPATFLHAEDGRTMPVFGVSAD